MQVFSQRFLCWHQVFLCWFLHACCRLLEREGSRFSLQQCFLKPLQDIGQKAFMAQNLAAHWVAVRTANLPGDLPPLVCGCYDMCVESITTPAAQASAPGLPNPFKVANLCASRSFYSGDAGRSISCLEGAVGQLGRGDQGLYHIVSKNAPTVSSML